MNREIGRLAIFIAVVGMVAGIGHTGPGALANLAFQLDLKERLAFDATEMASFFAIVAAPWYTKPIVGVLVDLVPIRGSRYRAYLTIGWFGATTAWLVLALAPRGTAVMLALALSIELSITLSSAVLGAVLASQGKRTGSTGRLTSIRLGAIFIGGLVGTPLGAWLATREFWGTCVACMGLQGMLLIASLTCLEPEADPGPRRWREAAQRLSTMFRSRALVIATAIGFLIVTAPGFGTALFYHQTDVLHHAADDLGVTRVAATIGATSAALIYAFACRRIALRRLLAIGIVLDASAALLFLFLDEDLLGAVAIMAAHGGCTALVLLPLWDLSARVATPGQEALAYALTMSALNFGQSMSDVLGTSLLGLGIDFEQLILINSLTSFAALLLVPLIPTAIVEHSDS